MRSNSNLLLNRCPVIRDVQDDTEQLCDLNFKPFSYTKTFVITTKDDTLRDENIMSKSKPMFT